MLLQSVARRLHPGCHTLLPRCPPVRRYRCTAEVIVAEDFPVLSFRKPTLASSPARWPGEHDCSCFLLPAGSARILWTMSCPLWALGLGTISLRLVVASRYASCPARHFRSRSSLVTISLCPHLPAACLPCARAPLHSYWLVSTRPFGGPQLPCPWGLRPSVHHSRIGGRCPSGRSPARRPMDRRPSGTRPLGGDDARLLNRRALYFLHGGFRYMPSLPTVLGISYATLCGQLPQQ